MPMPFCQADRIVVPTWVSSGSPLTGYELAHLTDQDPSYPHRIAEPSITLTGTITPARRVDGLAVIHHNLVAGTPVQLVAKNGAGATIATIPITVPPWLGRWAPHLYFDLAAAIPSPAARTVGTLLLSTTAPNTAPVQIGELVTAGEVDTFSGILVDAKPSFTFGRTLVEGKKGPQYIHDRRTRDRRWEGAAVLESALDIAAFVGLQQASAGVAPFLIWPLNSIADEPIYARFIDPGYEFILPVDLTIARLEKFAVRELACGEAY